MTFWERDVSFLALIKSGKELGLSLVLCSYYLSGIVGEHFGSQLELLASAFPALYGCLILFWFMVSRVKLLVGGEKVILFSAFVLCLIFFSIFNVESSLQLFSYALRFFYSAVFMVFIAWVVASDKNFDLARFFIIFCFIVTSIVIYSFFWWGQDGGRLSVSGRNPIYFSLLCSLTFIVSFFYLSSFLKFGLINRLFLIYFLVISFFGLVLSGGRGAALSLAVTLLVYWFCYCASIVFSGKIKRHLNFWFLLPLFILGVLGVSHFFDSRAINGLVTLFSGEVDASGNERITLLIQWLALFEKSPLLGVGFPSSLSYPHNILLELVFRHGIMGGVAAVYLTYLVLRCSLRGFLSRGVESRIISALVLCSFIAGLFSFSIVMKSHLFIFIVLSLVVGLKHKNPESWEVPADKQVNY